jgi:Clathrin light chain
LPASQWLIGFQALKILIPVRRVGKAWSLPSDVFTGTEPTGTASGEGSFLDRERAALGEDADQFATAQDRATTSATVQDGDDDLLGGDDDFGAPQHAAATTQEDLDFETSYPAIDTQNEV